MNENTAFYTATFDNGSAALPKRAIVGITGGKLANAAAGNFIGVVDTRVDAPAANEVNVNVVTSGVAWCVASVAINVGDPISIAASGRVAKQTTNVIGVALTSAGNAGDEIKVQLK